MSQSMADTLLLPVSRKNKRHIGILLPIFILIYPSSDAMMIEKDRPVC